MRRPVYLRERDENNHGSRPCGAGFSGVQHETTYGRHARRSAASQLRVAERGWRNGEATGGLLNLEFGENLHVSGAMCNRFFGQGQLRDGVLTVKPLATTRRLCPDEQRNRWDQVIAAVLENGAEVTLSAQQLTLNGSGHTLIYTLRDWVY